MQRFSVKGKLAPRYVGPFEIIEVCGPVAYHLQLPSQLAAIHDIFHVSQLRKCVKIPAEIIDSQSSEIQPDLSYTEHPIKVLDTKDRSTRRETIRMFKIQWDHHTEEEATWETESYLQRNFPDFLQANSQIRSSDSTLFRNLGMRFFLGGKAVTFRYLGIKHTRF
jgi:hypothetical protein